MRRIPLNITVSHLESLRLVKLDGGFLLMKVFVENIVVHTAHLVQYFLFAVNAAADIKVPGVLQTLGTHRLHVGKLEQGLVVRSSGRIRPLEVEGLFLPEATEELLLSHGVDEALEEASGAV